MNIYDDKNTGFGASKTNEKDKIEQKENNEKNDIHHVASEMVDENFRLSSQLKNAYLEMCD